ncbi:DsbA family protein [Candidatus Parcubacteria bacterium]|nr:MAG: DsbA family protein [Candidatus Parcubacteria bacterium]
MEQINSNNQEKSGYLIPLAIIIAGGLVAAAMFFGGSKGGKIEAVVEDDVKQEISVKALSSSDYVRGNPNASVAVIEFSDTECPYCKKFHYTMNQILDEYGKSGKVAWVYRHFPLDSIHSKARKEAEALECAGELGGNAKFWAYLDEIFAVTPSNDGLDLAELPKIAQKIGLDKNSFTNCLDSGRHAKNVEDDLQDGISAGARGTPYSVVLTKSGKKFVINGAQPYENVKAILDQALKEK